MIQDALGSMLHLLRHPANQAGRSAAILRYMRWQLGSRILREPVAMPFIDDSRLLVESSMHGATGNYYYGLQEFEDMAFVLHHMRPDDEFHDVGGNVGAYAIAAAVAGAAHVHTYEPSPSTAALLKRNVDLNALGHRITIHECALGSDNGVVELVESDSNVLNHVRGPSDKKVGINVAIHRLDDHRPAGGQKWMMKIDVEGYEAHVLSGAGSALSDPSLMAVIMEANDTGLQYPDSSIYPMDTMQRNGFTACTYDPFNRVLSLRSRLPSSGNVLFLRDLDVSQERVSNARQFAISTGSI